MKNKILILLFLFIFAFFTKVNAEDTLELLMKADKNLITKDKVFVSPFKGLREKTLSKVAFQLGYQYAVQEHYKKLIKILEEKYSVILDQIFNFKPLLLNGGYVLPPVIREIINNFTLINENLAHSTLISYKIIKEARIVTKPPTWRSYLIQEYKPIEKINPALLPQNSEEKKLWQEYVEKGWESGKQQAERLLEINLSKLRQDYLGMLEFKYLEKQGVVSLPVFSVGKVGIKVGDKYLNVGQTVFRIVKKEQFNKVEKWKPIPILLDKTQNF